MKLHFLRDIVFYQEGGKFCVTFYDSCFIELPSNIIEDHDYCQSLFNDKRLPIRIVMISIYANIIDYTVSCHTALMMPMIVYHNKK